jgi:hypothetical protein
VGVPVGSANSNVGAGETGTGVKVGTGENVGVIVGVTPGGRVAVGVAVDAGFSMAEPEE